MNSIGIVGGLLIAFYNSYRNMLLKCRNDFFKQRGFSRTGGTQKIKRKNIARLKISAVPFGKTIVFLKDILFKRNSAALFFMMMMVFMIMTGLMMMMISMTTALCDMNMIIAKPWLAEHCPAIR